MKKATKKTKTPLAAKAAAQLQKELAPIFKACNALSKKYAALSAAETKKEKAAEKLSFKNPGSVELQKLFCAHGDLSATYSDIADYLRYAAHGDKFGRSTPNLEYVDEVMVSDFYHIDEIAKLSVAAKPKAVAAKPKHAKPSKDWPLKVVDCNTKPTGGAPLAHGDPAILYGETKARSAKNSTLPTTKAKKGSK